MSEQQRGYEGYMPGDVVRMLISIRHQPMHLQSAVAVFRHSGGIGSYRPKVRESTPSRSEHRSRIAASATRAW